MKYVFLDNLHYFFGQTDGTYDFPNSAEGDLIKQAKKEIEHRTTELEICEVFYRLTVRQRDKAWKELNEKDKLLARCAEAMEIAQFYADGTEVCKEMDKLIDEIKGE